MQVHLLVFTSRYRYGNSYLLQNQPLSPPTDKTLKYHLHYYSLPNITWNLPDQAISRPVHVKLTNGGGNIACDSLTCHYCHKKRIKTPSLHRCSSTPSCPCKHDIATHHRLNRIQCHLIGRLNESEYENKTGCNVCSNLRF